MGLHKVIGAILNFFAGVIGLSSNTMEKENVYEIPQKAIIEKDWKKICEKLKIDPEKYVVIDSIDPKGRFP